MAVRKKFGNALGRGLDALLAPNETEVHTSGSSTINEIDIDKISVNPNQPRREFDESGLQELADSIHEIGIVQPITVRDNGDGSYMIIAGERRFRAAKIAGLQAVPAYIRTADDESILEMALIENIQREDLNSMEISLAYQHLLEQYDLTQEDLSKRVGKKRTTVANYLRLLKLPAQVQVALQNKEIDMGHARALLALDDPKKQLKLFNEIQKNDYSVRKVEEMAKAMNEGESVKGKEDRVISRAKNLPPEYQPLRQHLSDVFKTKVQMSCSEKGKGKISIPFSNESELEYIMELLDKIVKE